MATNSTAKQNSGANLGFEATLWAAADKLRGHMDAAEYIRGIEADLGDENADSFHRDLHKDLKADYILANPPFNMTGFGD